MVRAIIIAVFLFLPLASVFATSHVAQFVFVTEPRTVNPGEISEEITIQAQDSAGNTATTTETTDLEFSSTSLTGEFLNASGEPVRTIMNRGTANRTFYYRDSAEGVQTLKVKATGRDSGKSWEASQKITVSGGDPAASPLPPSPPPPGASVPSSPPPSTPTPTIKAHAGEDKTVTVGSAVSFLGSATGLEGKPLESARFWWNFGDGESKEGHSIAHIFMIPATYIVGLHVSSAEYAASDYLKITVIPNQIEVSGVVIGDSGYLKIRNPSLLELDIGGWVIEDAAGKRFIIPPKTKIAANSEIAFANSTTGLLGKGEKRLTIYYANLTKALEWSYSSEKIEGPAAPSLKKVILSEAKNLRDSPIVPPPAELIKDDDTAEKASSSEIVASELAQIPQSSSGSRFLFWIALGFSFIAAGGFLALKHFGKF